MNVAALVGRLTRDPELRYTSSGVATCTFTLAVDNPFAKQDPKADFLPIVTWKQMAEACASHLKKGRMCSVEGRIATRNYDHKDGHKVYVTEIIANNVRFLGDNGKQGQQGENTSEQQPSSNNEPPVTDDDLPF